MGGRWEGWKREGWKMGRMEDGKDGRGKDAPTRLNRKTIRSGRMEEWKSGRVEEWKMGRWEDWKDENIVSMGVTLRILPGRKPLKSQVP